MVAGVPEGESDKVLIAYVVAEAVPPSRRSLAEHVKSRLPTYARPNHYVFLPSLPLNSNGKVDRRALPPVTAEIRDGGSDVATTGTEVALAQIWCQVLGMKEVGVEANFFDLGGHSLLALKLFSAIQRQFAVDLPISKLFQNATIRDLAQVIDLEIGTSSTACPRGDATAAPKLPIDTAPLNKAATMPGSDAGSKNDEWDTSTVINTGPGTGRNPVFIVGGVGGNVNNLHELGSLIGQSRPVIGFQTRGILGHTSHDSIEAMATDNLRYLRMHQPKGPYLIAGYSGGALTAFEMARQIIAMGEEVRHLFVLDTYAPGFARNFKPKTNVGLKGRLADELDYLRTRPESESVKRFGRYRAQAPCSRPGSRRVQTGQPDVLSNSSCTERLACRCCKIYRRNAGLPADAVLVGACKPPESCGGLNNSAAWLGQGDTERQDPRDPSAGKSQQHDNRRRGKADRRSNRGRDRRLIRATTPSGTRPQWRPCHSGPGPYGPPLAG